MFRVLLASCVCVGLFLIGCDGSVPETDAAVVVVEDSAKVETPTFSHESKTVYRAPAVGCAGSCAGAYKVKIKERRGRRLARWGSAPARVTVRANAGAARFAYRANRGTLRTVYKVNRGAVRATFWWW